MKTIMDQNLHTERAQLLREIKSLEATLQPKKDRLHEILVIEAESVKSKIKQALLMKDTFLPEELIFAATTRCECGAGMAYPEGIGMRGQWHCSDILMGKASPIQPHTSPLPFSFYEIKSENQPSANGQTTRPESSELS